MQYIYAICLYELCQLNCIDEQCMYMSLPIYCFIEFSALCYLQAHMWAGGVWIFMGWYLHVEPMSHQQIKNIYITPTQLDTFIQDFFV